MGKESFMAEIMPFFANHPILSIAWLGLLVAVVSLTVKGWFSKVKVVTRNQAMILINRENGQVVDVRQREEFQKGHITHAINVLPSEIKEHNWGALDKHKEDPLIVVCDMGNLARESAELLYRAGFSKVFVLKEGISGWNSENLPLVKGK